jgi:hypothetical protein
MQDINNRCGKIKQLFPILLATKNSGTLVTIGIGGTAVIWNNINMLQKCCNVRSTLMARLWA